MAKRHKFYFNPHDLTYIKYNPKNSEKYLKVGGLFATLLFIGMLFYSVRAYQQKSPEEARYIQLINFYKRQVAEMNNKLANANTVVKDIADRDKQISIILEGDSLSSSELNGGIGGTNSYADLEGFEESSAIVTTHQKLDNVNAKLSVLSQSYKELLKLASNKEQMLKCMPAIQPVSNKNLREIASGFGMRIHPIYGEPKMHEGIDFAAPTGTPVCATGDGVVEETGYSNGYGMRIIIDHKWGYETLYAHLSKSLVHNGQKIKRGQIIGKVGSTGLSTGSHLHYEVIKNSRKINPIDYFHNDLTTSEYEAIVKLANQSKKSLD